MSYSEFPLIKEKSWMWIVGKRSYTTIGNTIYCPKGKTDLPKGILDHEIVHIRQQKDVGVTRFVFKYLFCLPAFYNSFRYKMEHEAYSKAQGVSDLIIEQVMSLGAYGWLRKPKGMS